MRCYLSLLFLILTVIFSSPKAQATMVLSINLEQMTDIADRIFLGKVDSVEDAFDPEGRWCQYVRFSINEIYKGDLEVGDVLKIKQVNPKKMKTLDGTIIKSSLFSGVPQFKEGEEVIVFLAGESRIGFSSPVGLSQGAFRIVVDEFGTKKVVNGLGNIGLFKEMSARAEFKVQGIDEARFGALQAKPQDLSLDQMRSLLKILIKQKVEEE